MLNRKFLITVFCAVLCRTSTGQAQDDDISLHRRIDRLIADATENYGQFASQPVAEAEFLRRVCLDLTGRIPSAAQRRAFLSNRTDDKRTELIDRLLKSPEHARRLQHYFDVLLMQRRPKKYVEPAKWREYLFTSIRENKSWRQLSRELLSADGTEDSKRGPARFLLDRDLKTEETTRDLGRVFLGRDLQCAQCHDHPDIEEYAQRHYFGISAFLNRSYVFKDPKSKQASIGEKADGTVKFTSVFTSEEAETAPRILDLPAIEDPQPDREPYVAKPDSKTRGVPKYSRRLLLADAVTDPANQAFRLTIANRLWALVMGRGLVEPLDMFHSENPPSHPKLLDVLADDLAAHDYDMRHTIREIVLSQTYQRSSLLCDNLSDSATGEANSRLGSERGNESSRYFSGLLKPLSPEQLAWSMMQACGLVDITQAAMAVKLQKESPDLKPDSTEYEWRLEALVNKELQPHVDTFVTIFASANESSRFDATAKQALFVLNGPLIGQWLQPADGNLMSRLQSVEDQQQVANIVFPELLTRTPTKREVTALSELLKAGGNDRRSVLQQAVRSILCSAEFRFNH